MQIKCPWIKLTGVAIEPQRIAIGRAGVPLDGAKTAIGLRLGTIGLMVIPIELKRTPFERTGAAMELLWNLFARSGVASDRARTSTIAGGSRPTYRASRSNVTACRVEM